MSPAAHWLRRGRRTGVNRATRGRPDRSRAARGRRGYANDVSVVSPSPSPRCRAQPTHLDPLFAHDMRVVVERAAGPYAVARRGSRQRGMPLVGPKPFEKPFNFIFSNGEVL